MIIIQPVGGLCNYLRVIFSYYEYAKSVNSQLTVLWEKTNSCNGHFLDYFEPISNIIFISKKPENSSIYYKGCSVCPNFKPNYTELKLLPFMKEKIINKLKIIGTNYISAHIRRTDHISLAMKNNKFTSDKEFEDFIENNNNFNVYIATDNIDTYNKFKKKYNNRIKLDFHNTLPNNLRHTTLEDAILDIYLCVYSTHFMGSGWSSFSDFINQLREINI
jgi:hypothetical protein